MKSQQICFIYCHLTTVLYCSTQESFEFGRNGIFNLLSEWCFFSRVCDCVIISFCWVQKKKKKKWKNSNDGSCHCLILSLRISWICSRMKRSILRFRCAIFSPFISFSLTHTKQQGFPILSEMSVDEESTYSFFSLSLLLPQNGRIRGIEVWKTKYIIRIYRANFVLSLIFNWILFHLFPFRFSVFVSPITGSPSRVRKKKERRNRVSHKISVQRILFLKAFFPASEWLHVYVCKLSHGRCSACTLFLLWLVFIKPFDH